MLAPVTIPLSKAVAETRAALVLAEQIPSEATRRQLMHYPLAKLEEAKAANPGHPAVRNTQVQASQAMSASAGASPAPQMAAAAVDGRGGNVDTYA